MGHDEEQEEIDSKTFGDKLDCRTKISKGQQHTYLVLDDPMAHDRQDTVIFPPTLALRNVSLSGPILPIRNMTLILAFLFLDRMWRDYLSILRCPPLAKLKGC